MPRNLTLHELEKRLTRLEQRTSAPLLVLPHPRAVPGCPLLPEADIDGTPIPWEQRTYWIIWPGKAKRPLQPGEYERLKAIFGDRLVEPFACRIGDATRRPLGSRDDGGDDEDRDDDDE